MTRSDHHHRRCSRRARCVAGSIDWLSVIAIAVFVMLPGCRPSEDVCPPERPEGQEPMPPPAAEKLSQLELLPLTGDSQPVTLAELEGRVVLINFWGTWCPPCLVELPHIAEIEKRFRDDPDFKLLAVSCNYEIPEDVADLRSKTSEFLQQVNIDMPTYVDPEGVSRSAVDDAVGFQGYPTTLLLDRQGVIRKVWAGYTPGVEKEMEKLISQLLEEK